MARSRKRKGGLQPQLVPQLEAVVDPDVVRLLEDMLERAKSGSLRSVAVASTTPDGGRVDYNVRPTDIPQLLLHIRRMDKMLYERFAEGEGCG